MLTSSMCCPAALLVTHSSDSLSLHEKQNFSIKQSSRRVSSGANLLGFPGLTNWFAYKRVVQPRGGT